jgi:hypothetical protein
MENHNFYSRMKLIYLLDCKGFAVTQNVPGSSREIHKLVVSRGEEH